MKKHLPLLLVSLTLAFTARAQVFIVNDAAFSSRMSTLKVSVQDSLTHEPIPFASVYVIPSKDTTITNFTLTDAKGEAKLEEVPFGSYVFRVEMMGYKPFVKERYFRERTVDMGTIFLNIDQQYLQEAVISDVGNPIVVKQDTVEFNAASFRTGSNAMLKDLLQRMPGIEITEEGKVKFNGEAIDKLTVGGRTFFFNDQTTALNNLPAAIVDKVRIIDRDSESSRASGIDNGNKEKILDVGLKKEYEKGWFGNIAAKGGTTLGSDGDAMHDNRGPLYSASALASAYTDKDQVTAIANGLNINDGPIMIIVSSDGKASNIEPGLTATAQLGANANTSRIKGTETTASVNYRYGDTKSGSRTERTTFQPDGDLLTLQERDGRQFSNSFKTNLEFQREKGKVWFHIRPNFNYERNDTRSGISAETFREGAALNRTDNDTRSLDIQNSTGTRADIAFREIGGKKGRIFRLAGTAGYTQNHGESDEYTYLAAGSSEEFRNLHYDIQGHEIGGSASLSYTEPLGSKWVVYANAGLSGSMSLEIRDAKEMDRFNDYYSSERQTRYLSQDYGMSVQYKFGKSNWITLGTTVNGIRNETFSKTYGISDTTGKDEWIWSVMPTLSFQYAKGYHRLNFGINGSANRPSAWRMLPVLDVSNAASLSLGNIYLQPYTRSSLSGSWYRNDRQRFSNLMVIFTGNATARPLVSARWYDEDGIQYAIPVNAQKPTLSGYVMVNYTTPLDEKKIWSLTLGSSINYISSASYQSRGTRPGLDKEQFDYTAFMNDFWGDAGGSRFYSGQSGFAESRTQNILPDVSVHVKYNMPRYWISASVATSGRLARYSVDPKANLNTADSRFSVRGSYTTKHEFEISSGIEYRLHSGYAEGYGKPECKWDGEISKNIGAFNLSIKLNDILNQTRYLSHTVTDNYEEDSYRLVMGRYVIFGLKWNFGKMNAAHNQRAQRAAMRLAF